MCFAGHIPKYCMPLKGSFQWWMCERQKYGVRVKGGFPFYAVAVVSSNVCGGMGGCGIILPDWTLFLMNPWKRHFIRQYRKHGSNLSSETEESHNGAQVHFALPVRDLLNYLFPGPWFGRGWPKSPAPLTWPPRGSELTTPDNSLWGSINRRVSVPHCNANEECHRAAEGVFRTNAPTHVTENMEAHPLLCLASGCTYGYTGHVTKK